MTDPARAVVALVLQLAALVWFARGDFPRHRLFAGWRTSEPGRRRYRRWIAKSWIGFALTAVVVLVLLGRAEAVLAMPAAFRAAARLVPQAAAGLDLIGAMVVGMMIGNAVVLAIAWWRSRRPRVRRRSWIDLSRVVPARRDELPGALLSAITAGVCEELFFRLSLPLAIVLLGLPAWSAFALALLLFAALHRYQGWLGMLGSGLAGAALTGLYLATGALWVAIAAHVLIDFNALVVRPVLGGVWRR